VSLRGRTIEEEAVLPDGRQALVRVGVLEDPYIAKRDLDTVAIELLVDGQHAAAVNTVLDVDDESAGVRLARQIAAGLASGELQPTAGALEPLADTLPIVEPPPG
jgi:hypothetical protein